MQEWDTQRTRDDVRQGTCVMQQTTDDSHRRTCTRRDATWDQATDSAHHGALGQATENRPQTTRTRPDPTDSNAADDKQAATCKAPLENVQQKIDDMQHAMGNMQQTTHSVQ